jgi:glycosyltransferase involved in cell wall biosynthesis
MKSRPVQPGYGKNTPEGPSREGVSVVVPAYNAAGTLADALRSLLGQTVPHWEAVIVDDGSSDGTADVAAQFAEKDQRFRVIRQANQGEAGARNAGIEAARFRWLLFLDADDWIAPTALEYLTDAAARDPEADAIHCRYARVAGDGTVVPEAYQATERDLFPVLARRAAFAVHACLVRKAVVDAAGRFDPTLKTSPDWDLWQRVARTGARFVAVPDVLAFYRMTPGSASLDGPQLFKDDLRVLRQGHAPDPRVPHPHPDHANGEPADGVRSQQFYLLCWCAGLMIGAGKDPGTLLDQVAGDRYEELYPEAVAQCLFEAAPLPGSRSPDAWPELWPRLRERIDAFLHALETHAGAPELVTRATRRLKQLILRTSPLDSLVVDSVNDLLAPLVEARGWWQRLADERERALDEHRALVSELRQTTERLRREVDEWRQVAEERTQSFEQERRASEALQVRLAESDADAGHWRQVAEERTQSFEQERRTSEALRVRLAESEADASTWRQATMEREASLDESRAAVGRLEQTTASLEEQVRQRTAERDALARSSERRFGDRLLNRYRLRRPFHAAARLRAKTGHLLTLGRLAADRLAGRRRMLTTVCDVFPIYSQTFVYQELTMLERAGFDVRLVYSQLDSRELLPPRFGMLWGRKRRLFLNDRQHRRDFAEYRRRMPGKVDHLIEKISAASGMSPEALVTHGNFLQAFSFTRMAEAYRPQYLHSYFFYDRSLMALVAGYLLDLPRGVSCYADHVLDDYELKLVPLHMELCDVVIATSARIKRELLEIAPNADPNRILVKPNGIDSSSLPVVERREPVPHQPFRLVSVCRIEPKKGLLDLVEAVALLRRRGVEVEAHIVGTVDEWSQASRDYKHKLDQRIGELDLWGKVHLEGRQGADGVRRFLAQAHLFVAPFVETATGDKDGIPTAVLEGMSTGLAVVATDAGSMTEVVEHGREGLIVPQYNHEALAAAIGELLADTERRAVFATRAAARVRAEFDVSVCEPRFHERIAQVLARRTEHVDDAKLPAEGRANS